MKVTCKHSQSSYGIPVILDDRGKVMDYGDGIKAILAVIGWDEEQLAVASGYKNARSIEKFRYGAIPSAQLLNVLSVELEKSQLVES